MADLWLEELDGLQADYPRQKWPYGKQLTDFGWDAFLTAMPDALARRDGNGLRLPSTEAITGSHIFCAPARMAARPTSITTRPKPAAS